MRDDGTNGPQQRLQANRGWCKPGSVGDSEALPSEPMKVGRKAKKGGTAKGNLSSLCGTKGFFIL